jgi:Xaa-Pro aminopeptidase
MDSDTLLMMSDSDHDANMLYAVGMFVPDPFIYLRIKNKCHIVLGDLEIDRARKQASHCRIVSLSQCYKKLRKPNQPAPGFARVIHHLLSSKGIHRVLVPANFPHGMAGELRRLKIKVEVKEGWFFPEREFKTPEEVKKISAALMMAEVGLAEGIQVLKSSKIGKNRRLIHHGVALTAEKLRAIIDIAVIQAGGLASHTIVAGGRQACDPHDRGSGPLRAHEPIIIDVFPRSQKTGYFGDITRTVVKGRAKEEIRRLYHTVAQGHELAFQKLRHGVPANEVHKTVQQCFEQQGYKTGKKNGHMEGFFHGTGHGLGLELHESPRASANSLDILQAGHVITIEPGLYYPSLGGVRLEDVAYITQKGARNLTKFEKTLEV